MTSPLLGTGAGLGIVLLGLGLKARRLSGALGAGGYWGNVSDDLEKQIRSVLPRARDIKGRRLPVEFNGVPVQHKYFEKEFFEKKDVSFIWAAKSRGKLVIYFSSYGLFTQLTREFPHEKELEKALEMVYYHEIREQYYLSRGWGRGDSHRFAVTGTRIQYLREKDILSRIESLIDPLPAAAKDHVRVHIGKNDAEELDLGAARADAIVRQQKGRINIAVGGGETVPALLDAWVRLIAENLPLYKSIISRMHVFMVYESRNSNTHQVVIDRFITPLKAMGISVDSKQVHAVNLQNAHTLEEYKKIAKDYTIAMRNSLGPKDQFDLILSGVGQHGEFAGFESNSPVIYAAKPVMIAFERRDGVLMTSLTPDVFRKARNIILVLIGPHKRGALLDMIAPEGSIGQSPARVIHEQYWGQTDIYTDRSSKRWPQKEFLLDDGTVFFADVHEGLKGSDVVIFIPGFHDHNYDQQFRGLPYAETIVVRRDDLPVRLGKDEVMAYYAQKIKAVIKYYQDQGRRIKVVTHSDGNEFFGYFLAHAAMDIQPIAALDRISPWNAADIAFVIERFAQHKLGPAAFGIGYVSPLLASIMSSSWGWLPMLGPAANEMLRSFIASNMDAFSSLFDQEDATLSGQLRRDDLESSMEIPLELLFAELYAVSHQDKEVTTKAQERLIAWGTFVTTIAPKEDNISNVKRIAEEHQRFISMKGKGELVELSIDPKGGSSFTQAHFIHRFAARVNALIARFPGDETIVPSAETAFEGIQAALSISREKGHTLLRIHFGQDEIDVRALAANVEDAQIYIDDLTTHQRVVNYTIDQTRRYSSSVTLRFKDGELPAAFWIKIGQGIENTIVTRGAVDKKLRPYSFFVTKDAHGQPFPQSPRTAEEAYGLMQSYRISDDETQDHAISASGQILASTVNNHFAARFIRHADLIQKINRYLGRGDPLGAPLAVREKGRVKWFVEPDRLVTILSQELSESERISVVEALSVVRSFLLHESRPTEKEGIAAQITGFIQEEEISRTRDAYATIQAAARQGGIKTLQQLEKKYRKDQTLMFRFEHRTAENVIILYRWPTLFDVPEVHKVHNDIWFKFPKEQMSLLQVYAQIQNYQRGHVVAEVFDLNVPGRQYIYAPIWSVRVNVSRDLARRLMFSDVAGTMFQTVDALTNDKTLDGVVSVDGQWTFNYATGLPTTKVANQDAVAGYLVKGKPLKGIDDGLVMTQAYQQHRDRIRFLRTYSPITALGLHWKKGAFKFNFGEIPDGRYPGAHAIIMAYPWHDFMTIGKGRFSERLSRVVIVPSYRFGIDRIASPVDPDKEELVIRVAVPGFKQALPRNNPLRRPFVKVNKDLILRNGNNHYRVPEIFNMTAVGHAKALLKRYLGLDTITLASLPDHNGMRLTVAVLGDHETRSFKPWINFGVIKALLKNRQINTVVTATTGNQGIALAWAVRMLAKTMKREDLKVIVYVGVNTSKAKIARMREFGAIVIGDPSRNPDVVFENYEAAYQAALKFSQIPEIKEKTYFVEHANRAAILGYAALGSRVLEILRPQDNADHLAIIVPVGAGGLASGFAVASRLEKDPTKVYMVQTTRTKHAYISLLTGKRVVFAMPQSQEYDENGIDTKSLEPMALKTLRTTADGLALVDPTLIPQTIAYYRAQGIIAEGAAVLPYLALEALKEELATKGITHVLLVATGSNVSDAAQSSRDIMRHERAAAHRLYQATRNLEKKRAKNGLMPIVSVGAATFEQGRSVHTAFNDFSVHAEGNLVFDVLASQVKKAHPALQEPLDRLYALVSMRKLSRDQTSFKRLVKISAQLGHPMKGLDVIVTYEPCPSCFNLLFSVGVRKVFYIDAHPNNEFAQKRGHAGLVKVQLESLARKSLMNQRYKHLVAQDQTAFSDDQRAAQDVFANTFRQWFKDHLNASIADVRGMKEQIGNVSGAMFWKMSRGDKGMASLKPGVHSGSLSWIDGLRSNVRILHNWSAEEQENAADLYRRQPEVKNAFLKNARITRDLEAYLLSKGMLPFGVIARRESIRTKVKDLDLGWRWLIRTDSHENAEDVIFRVLTQELPEDQQLTSREALMFIAQVKAHEEGKSEAKGIVRQYRDIRARNAVEPKLRIDPVWAKSERTKDKARKWLNVLGYLVGGIAFTAPLVNSEIWLMAVAYAAYMWAAVFSWILMLYFSEVLMVIGWGILGLFVSPVQAKMEFVNRILTAAFAAATGIAGYQVWNMPNDARSWLVLIFLGIFTHRNLSVDITIKQDNDALDLTPVYDLRSGKERSNITTAFDKTEGITLPWIYGFSPQGGHTDEDINTALQYLKRTAPRKALLLKTLVDENRLTFGADEAFHSAWVTKNGQQYLLISVMESEDKARALVRAIAGKEAVSGFDQLKRVKQTISSSGGALVNISSGGAILDVVAAYYENTDAGKFSRFWSLVDQKRIYISRQAEQTRWEGDVLLVSLSNDKELSHEIVGAMAVQGETAQGEIDRLRRWLEDHTSGKGLMPSWGMSDQQIAQLSSWGKEQLLKIFKIAWPEDMVLSLPAGTTGNLICFEPILYKINRPVFSGDLLLLQMAVLAQRRRLTGIIDEKARYAAALLTTAVPYLLDLRRDEERKQALITALGPGNMGEQDTLATFYRRVLSDTALQRPEDLLVHLAGIFDLDEDSVAMIGTVDNAQASVVPGDSFIDPARSEPPLAVSHQPLVMKIAQEHIHTHMTPSHLDMIRDEDGHVQEDAYTGMRRDIERFLRQIGDLRALRIFQGTVILPFTPGLQDSLQETFWGAYTFQGLNGTWQRDAETYPVIIANDAESIVHELYALSGREHHVAHAHEQAEYKAKVFTQWLESHNDFNIFYSGPKPHRMGALGLLKKIIPRMASAFAAQGQEARLNVLSWGGVRHLELPVSTEGLRVLMYVLEHNRMNLSQWNNVRLTPDNFKITVVADRLDTLDAKAFKIHLNHFKNKGELHEPNAARAMRGIYFGEPDHEGFVQLKEEYQGYFEFRGEDPANFQPRPQERFDLIIYNYLEFLLDLIQLKAGPIITARNISRLLKDRWLNEGGFLLTTEIKWIGFYREFVPILKGMASNIMFGQNHVPMSVFRFGSIRYDAGWFGQRIDRLTVRARKIIAQTRMTLNEALIGTAFDFATEAHFDTPRINVPWPYLKHPLSVLERLLSTRMLRHFSKQGIDPHILVVGALLHDYIEEKRQEEVDRIKDFKTLSTQNSLVRVALIEEGITQGLTDALLKVAEPQIAHDIVDVIIKLTKRLGESDKEYLTRLFADNSPLGLAAQTIKVFDRIDNFSDPRTDKPETHMINKISFTNTMINRSGLHQDLKRLYFTLIRRYYTPSFMRFNLPIEP